MGMTSQWMGTFWTMDSSTVMKMGEAGDGFMGVMPYRYYYDTSAKAPMLDKIRALRPEYQSTAYIQGFLARPHPGRCGRTQGESAPAGMAARARRDRPGRLWLGRAPRRPQARWRRGGWWSWLCKFKGPPTRPACKAGPGHGRRGRQRQGAQHQA